MTKFFRASATVGLMATAAAWLWHRAALSPPATPRVRQSLSPTNQGIAAFVRDDGPAGYRIQFFVCDPARGGQPRRVGKGYARDGDTKVRDAVWSGDGTVVAVRAGVGSVAGGDFTKSFGVFYVDAYDFRDRCAIAARAPVRVKSRRIERTLERRGGVGKSALPSPDAFGSSPMSAAEAAAYGRSGP